MAKRNFHHHIKFSFHLKLTLHERKQKAESENRYPEQTLFQHAILRYIHRFKFFQKRFEVSEKTK